MKITHTQLRQIIREEIVKLNEASKPKAGSPDYHQHKIAVDTIKNPRKSFFGGPDASEAEETLRKKFKYTDAEIKKLKNESITSKSVIKESDPDTTNYMMLMLPALAPILLTLVKSSIKSWWLKNKANKTIQQIMDRIKDDPEIKAFQANPKKYNWESLLRRKIGNAETEKLHKLYQTIEANS